MKLGITLPQVGALAGPEAIADIATFAEETGFESLWVLDRLLYPVNPATPYPASPDGSLPAAYTRALDPIGTLSWAAAVTSRVTVGTSVRILPYYNPVLLARQLATLDILSNGRLCVGLGTGWSPDEYAAVGVPMNTRGRRACEALEVIRNLWTADQPQYEGELYEYPACINELRPIQQPMPPVYMAAYAPGPMKRVAEMTDGWMPAGVPVEAMPAMFGQIREMATAAGRDASALKLVVRANITLLPDAIQGNDRPAFAGSRDQINDDIRRTREIGAHELFFDLQFSPGVDSIAAQKDLFGELFDTATA